MIGDVGRILEQGAVELSGVLVVGRSVGKAGIRHPFRVADAAGRAYEVGILEHLGVVVRELEGKYHRRAGDDGIGGVAVL